MGEAGASAAEGDTEGEQTQEDEDDGGANMNDWNEGEHAPNIRKEVDKAWSKLTIAGPAINPVQVFRSSFNTALQLVLRLTYLPYQG
jgi:hypothetical protein